MHVFIRMYVNELLPWDSSVKRHGVRGPKWGIDEHMQLECIHMEQLLCIEIRILTPLSSEVLGGAGFLPRVFRTISGDFQGVISLNNRGNFLGDLYVKTSYHPEAMH
jgi:hypothetical protein